MTVVVWKPQIYPDSIAQLSLIGTSPSPHPVGDALTSARGEAAVGVIDLKKP